MLNHVLLHQTVIGQEAIAQMELAGAFPDVVIGCVGGGSNFAGLAFPFIREKIAGREIDVLACEPAACPTLTRGLFAYDFGDTSKLTPLVPMHTLGHDFVPAPIHAGGLRYHGVAPLISQLVKDGLIRAEAYLQSDVFAAAILFANSEGIIPAPESSHAIHGALEAARQADEAGEQRTILFNLSGHGHFDMAAYDNYLAGKLEDVALDEEEIERALRAIEGLPRSGLTDGDGPLVREPVPLRGATRTGSAFGLVLPGVPEHVVSAVRDGDCGAGACRSRWSDPAGRVQCRRPTWRWSGGRRRNRWSSQRTEGGARECSLCPAGRRRYPA